MQDQIENTARLTRFDHVGVKLIEDTRVPAHRHRESRAFLNVLAHLQKDLLEILVVLLLGQDLETLHERQTRIDHH